MLGRQFHEFLILINVFLLLVLLYLVVIKLFRINTIKLDGSYTIPYGLDSLRGKNILFIKETDIAAWLIEKNSNFSSIEVEKQLPSSIKILAMERKAVAQIIAQNYVYLIDKEGVVFKAVKEPLILPKIEVLTGKIVIGNKIEKLYADSIFPLLSNLSELNIKVENVTLKSPDEIVIELPETTIFTDVYQDDSIISSSLQMMLTSFRIEGRLPRIIDVRFDKPVVRF